MTRPKSDDDGEPLFDLPLDPKPPSKGDRGAGQTQAELPLAKAPRDVEPAGGGAPQPPLDAAGGPAADAPDAPGRSILARRLTAGLLDVAAHLVVLGIAVAGSWWLGVPPSRLTFLPLVMLTAGFSFIYHVLPLVFWGLTPGMAHQGLVARSLDGGPLTMGQAVGRWLGALASVACLGLFFVFDRERSISDRLSGSTVHA